jgi:membrane associated rhomboid family serine protease
MRSARNPRNGGGRLRAPATLVLAAAMVLVYFGFQGGGLTLGASRGIEFRCNAVEYGLIPYEVTHPGHQLTDPYCQPQPESLLHSGETAAAEEGHDHPRSDAGIVADAPTWLTVATSTFMHGGVLPLAASVLFLVIFGPGLERRLGAARLLAVFLLAGLAAAATLVAVAPDLPIATIGSAGAVTGVIGAHLVLLRGARLTLFELPAPALLGAWILAQVAVANLDAGQPVAGAGGDIAYLAPAGGLIVGLLLAIPRLAPEVRPCPTSAPRS